MNMKEDFLYIFVHIPKCAGTTLAKHIELNYKDEEVLPLHLWHNKSQIEFKGLKIEDGVEKYLQNMPQEKKDKIKVIYGHDVFFGMHKHFKKRARYITFVRNPLNRAVSLYNYKRMSLTNPDTIKDIRKTIKNPEFRMQKLSQNLKVNGVLLDFGPWVKEKMPINDMCKFLFNHKFISGTTFDSFCSDDVRGLLEKFYFVGLTENEQDFFYLFYLLGIKTFHPDANISKKYYVPEKGDIPTDKINAKSKLDKALYDFAAEFNEKFRRSSIDFKINVKKIRIQKSISFWSVALKKKLSGIPILPKIYYKLSTFRPSVSRKTKCIIHIGTAKAGSSSIQHYMISNRKALVRQGILYPKFKRPFAEGVQRSNHKSLPYYAAMNDWIVDQSFNINNESEKIKWNKAFEKYIGHVLNNRKATVQTVLFSSEQLHLRLTKVCHVQKLKSFLSRFFDEIKVVVYLKPQSTGAVSRFSQQLKQNSQITDFFEGITYSNNFFDYLNMLDIWSQAVGQDNVLIRLMDDSDESIKDVVKDLTAIINADTNQLKNIEKNRNTALDSITQDLLILLNKYFSTEKKTALKKSIVKYLREASSGKQKLPAKKDAIAFDKRYFEKNRQIARKYLNKEQLFVVNYDKYPESSTSFSLKSDLNNKLDGLNIYLMTNNNLKDSCLNNWKEIYIKVQEKIQKLEA